jgi:peptide/nickel transport system substrate-binding protein
MNSKFGAIPLVSRRLLLSAAGALLTATMLAAPTPVLAEARDSVTIGVREDIPGLDPTIRQGAIIGLVTLGNIFEGLTRFNEDGSLSPGLAKSWEISPDGKTYTFKLVEGVKFSDGSGFDAADVKWTFERNGGADSTNPEKAYFALMEKIETPDENTVVLHLSEPNSLLLQKLAWGVSAIVAQETAAENAANPVGTGPFKLKAWDRGAAVTLTRNDLYREPARVKLNTVVFKLVEDPSAQVAAVQAGDVDFFPLFSSPESLEQFKSNPDLVVMEGASEAEVLLGINNRRKPLDNVLVRRALAKAIDRQAVVDGAEYGYGKPIGSHFSTNHPAYVDMTAVNAYDPEAAKALLAEAGYPEGFETTIKVPPQGPFVRSAEIVAAYFEQVGVKLKIEKVQWPQWLEQVFQNHSYDISIVDHVSPMDFDVYANPNFFFGYDSPEFQAIWQEIKAAATEEQQTAAFKKMQDFLAKDVPALFLYQARNISIARKGLTGLWKSMPTFKADMTEVYWAD